MYIYPYPFFSTFTWPFFSSVLRSTTYHNPLRVQRKRDLCEKKWGKKME